MPRIGYARISSPSQDLDIQKARLKEAGCEVIRTETSSGGPRTGRTELQDILEFLREGDELVVHRLNRFGRVIAGERQPTCPSGISAQLTFPNRCTEH